MKTIKLSLIFLAIVGGIFLAINSESLFGGDREESFVEVDLINISDKCNDIRSKWASESGWNAELYEKLRGDIDQSKAMGMFSREGYNTVNNCLRETSVNKACDNYMSTLQAARFSDADLQKSYRGVIMIKEREKLEKDIRINKVEQIHDLYTKIREFIMSRHVIKPEFNKDKATWVSFASRQNRILQEAKKYRDNSFYAELKGIPGFEQGLSERVLKENTGSQRKDFYEKLRFQIIRHFESVEPTQDNVDRLKHVFENFVGQEKEEAIVSVLADFVISYRSESENNNTYQYE